MASRNKIGFSNPLLLWLRGGKWRKSCKTESDFTVNNYCPRCWVGVEPPPPTINQSMQPNPHNGGNNKPENIKRKQPIIAGIWPQPSPPNTDQNGGLCTGNSLVTTGNHPPWIMDALLPPIKTEQNKHKNTPSYLNGKDLLSSQCLRWSFYGPHHLYWSMANKGGSQKLINTWCLIFTANIFLASRTQTHTKWVLYFFVMLKLLATYFCYCPLTTLQPIK